MKNVYINGCTRIEKENQCQSQCQCTSVNGIKGVREIDAVAMSQHDKNGNGCVINMDMAVLACQLWRIITKTEVMTQLI